jgi:hypothetical protein
MKKSGWPFTLNGGVKDNDPKVHQALIPEASRSVPKHELRFGMAPRSHGCPAAGQ